MPVQNLAENRGSFLTIDTTFSTSIIFFGGEIKKRDVQFWVRAEKKVAKTICSTHIYMHIGT